MNTPRYIVRAINFKCVDESGPDWSGSDEPYWIFTAKSEDVEPVTSASEEFGDVDSGNTRKFKASNNGNIYWPAKGAIGGKSGSIGLSVVLFEADQGNKEKMRKSIDTAFSVASLYPGVGKFIAATPSIIKQGLASWVGDDYMGAETFYYSSQDLAGRLPRVGSSFTEKRRFTKGGGVGNPADYDLTIQVERVR